MAATDLVPVPLPVGRGRVNEVQDTKPEARLAVGGDAGLAERAVLGAVESVVRRAVVWQTKYEDKLVTGWSCFGACIALDEVRLTTRGNGGPTSLRVGSVNEEVLPIV